MGNNDTVNPALVARADVSAKVVLEIGCGSGAFARVYRQRNPGAVYIGIEFDEAKAKQATPFVDHILRVDIQTKSAFGALDKILDGRHIDLLIIDGVLERLWEPQVVMRHLYARMSDTARAEICVPNIAHWSTLKRLLKGDWTYGDQGLLDRKHMRFFTKDTARAMMTQAGWHTRQITPQGMENPNGEKHAKAFGTLAKELGFDAEVAQENMMPLQWVFGLSKQKPTSEPLRIFAIGIGTKVDALTKIRVRQPLQPMLSAGRATVALSTGSYAAIPPGRPGVFLTYRLHPENKERRAEIDQKCKDGWLFVHDVDDHPAYLKGQKQNNFWSIKAAHAVTVSTPALAEVCRKWNPNVFVVENQISETSTTDMLNPQGDKPRLFFGALNRADDWQSQCKSMVDYLIENKDRIACDVVHEPSLTDSLAGKADATFHPTQTLENFTALLARSDFALLPLSDTEFNQCKSDLKVIECLAHGVIPICSPFTAAQTTVPNEFLCIAKKPSDWPRLLDDLLDDPDDLKRRKAAGLKYIQNNRMWSIHAPKLAGLYESLMADHANLETQRQTRLPR